MIGNITKIRLRSYICASSDVFLPSISSLEEGVRGKILKFADDTKLFRKVKEIGDKQHLQDDIDKLVKWSEKWQMLFNFGKCKVYTQGREIRV